jgi:hypothetical protein
MSNEHITEVTSDKEMMDFLTSLYRPVRVSKSKKVVPQYERYIRPPTDGIDGTDGKDGAPGKDGKDGLTPVRGVHYWTPQDRAQIKQELQALIPKVRDGIDGKDAVIDESAFESFLQWISEHKLRIEHIKGLDECLQVLSNQVGGYVHGGGDTVAAGTNVAVTSNTQGQKVISFTGVAGLSYETPTGTVDDSNIAFVVLHDPTFLIINGSQYFVGTGIYQSYNSGTKTITLSSPVGTGGFIRSAYA